MLILSSDFKLVVASLFGMGWRLFTSFNIPGTNINVVELSVAALVLWFVIRHVLPIVGADTKKQDSGGDDRPRLPPLNSSGPPSVR